MGARAISTVVVTLGMMNIGVKLFVSAKSENISFRQINPETKNPVGQKMFDKVTDEEVQRGDLIKGYEYMKDQYVFFTDEEITNMAEDKRDSLDIQEFVPVSQINPIHIEKTYYTGPDKGMSKSYRLLYETLKSSKTAAVGTWVARGKEHLIILRAYEHGIIAHQMFYDSEVRAFDDTCDKIEISPVELAMGKMLVEKFTVPRFDKSKYSDKFIDRVTKAVEMKIADGDAVVTATDSKKKISTATVDNLRKSLEFLGMDPKEIDKMVVEAGGEPVSAPKKSAPDVAKRKRSAKAKAKSA